MLGLNAKWSIIIYYLTFSSEYFSITLFVKSLIDARLIICRAALETKDFELSSDFYHFKAGTKPLVNPGADLKTITGVSRKAVNHFSASTPS